MYLVIILICLAILLFLLALRRTGGSNSGKRKRRTSHAEHSAALEAVAIREKLAAKENHESDDDKSTKTTPHHEEEEEEDEETTPVLDEKKQDITTPVIHEIPEELLMFRLLTEEDLSEMQMKEILNLIKNIPRPSGIFTPLSVGQFGPKELAELVSQDPEIAAKILRVVNSAAYHLHKKINSVNRAVVFLGTTLVRDIAMRLAMQNSFKAKTPEQELAYQKFWKMSIIASAVAKRMAQLFEMAEPSAVATRALLSFIGNLAILAHRPDFCNQYANTQSLFERIQIEQAILGANSALIGQQLAMHWKLPDIIEKCIGENLVPLIVPPATCEVDDVKELVLCYACCRIGEQMAFQNLEDIAHCEISPQQGHEYIYLDEYLEIAGLSKFERMLQHMKLRKEIGFVIEQLALYEG